MSYSIIWSDDAEQQLADTWMNAADPNAVTAAANRIDYLLSRDPLGQGESRDGNDRIAFEGPLGVIYQVDSAAQQVTVVSVGPSGHS